MTQKRKSHIALSAPNNGVPNNKFGFVFSDRIEDWMVSQGIKNSEKQRKRYAKAK